MMNSLSDKPEIRISRGFTLAELLVVVLIIGILVAVAVPQYVKTVENSKADDAVSTLKMIGTTNRMYNLDKGSYATSAGAGGGALTTANNGAGCIGVAPFPAADLLGCKYLATQDWDSKPYQFYAIANGADNLCNNPNCIPAGGANYVACAKRRSGASPGTNSAPYYDAANNTWWGYEVDNSGKIYSCGGANPEN